MKKYRVELAVSGFVTLEVMAESQSEAEDLAEEQYGEGIPADVDVHDWSVYQTTEIE